MTAFGPMLNHCSSKCFLKLAAIAFLDRRRFFPSAPQI